MRKGFLLFYLTSFCVTSLCAQEAGFKASLRGGVAFGSPMKESYYNLDIVLGYQFKDSFYVGIGTGLNNSYAEYEAVWYASRYASGDDYIAKDRLLPLFVRVKCNLAHSRISPFVAGDVGYLIAVTRQVLREYQGFFGVAAFGVDFYVDTRQRHYFSVQLGILIQGKDWYFRLPWETSPSMVMRPDIKVVFTF